MRVSDIVAQQVLEQARSSATLRHLRTFDGPAAARVLLDGQSVVMLASNNYLDLATHPLVVDAAARGARDWGCAAGGSRLISGSLRCHAELEDELAAFFGEEAALVFGSGYMVNTGVIPALVGAGDVIVSDALVHASLIDGARLSRAEVVVFPHADVSALTEVLQRVRSGARRILIVVDGVYSMDGDLAPLREIVALSLRFDAMTMIDDAHGVGALGAAGRGSVELSDLLGQADLVVGTLGKALGSFGAFVACSALVRDLIVNAARSFIFSCALAPAQVEAARAGLRLLASEPWRRERLQQNAARLRARLHDIGVSTAPSTTHIVPVVLGDNERTLALAAALLERGFYVQAIRYPSVPHGSARLRITPMATHSDEDLDRFVEELQELARAPECALR
jgi:8-amino-7-oxononanoate synthase